MLSVRATSGQFLSTSGTAAKFVLGAASAILILAIVSATVDVRWAGIALLGLAAVAGASLIVREARHRAFAAHRPLREWRDALPALIWTADAAGSCTEVGGQWVAFAGVPADDLLGTGWLDRVHPEDATAVRDAWFRAVASAAPFRSEFRLRHGDGSYRWFQSAADPIRDGRGRAIRWAGCHNDVDERKRERDRFKFDAEILRETGHIAKVGGWTFDVATGEGYWTEEVARIHDLDPGTTISKEVGLTFFPPSSRPRIEAAVVAAIRDGVAYDLELELVSAIGAHKWIRTCGRPVVENGKVVRVRGSFQDITERVNAEIERRQLADMIEHNRDFIAVADLTGRLTYMNPGGRRMIGLDQNADLGDLHFTEYLPEAWRKFLVETVVPTVREKGLWEGEMQLRNLADGRILDVERSAFLIRDPLTGEPRCFATVTRDITERKRAERRVTAQTAIGRTLVACSSLAEAAPEILEALCRAERWDFGTVWEVDAPAEVLRCVDVWHSGGAGTAELAVLTRGMTFASGIGLPGRVWCDPHFEAVGVSEIQSDPGFLRAGPAAAAGLVSAVAFPIVAGNEIVGVIDAMSRTPIHDDAVLRDALAEVGRKVGMFVLKRRAEDELRRLNAELERRVANRTAALVAANEELQAFSYSVSHDLRSPLRAIDGFSRIVAERYSDALPEKARGLLRDVRSNVAQMNRLIDDLLALSRLGRQPLERQPINVEAMVRTAFAELSPPASFELRVGPLPECRADPVLFKQVWHNLLGNAVKYGEKRENPFVEVTGRDTADGPEYTVRDNGVGFDMRYADRIFGVFQRLHRADEFEGNGVGLAIVQRLLARHGGRIRAHGVPNVGATFTFTVPPDGGPPPPAPNA